MLDAFISPCAVTVFVVLVCDLEIPVKEGRRSAPTVRLVRSYRCEAPPSIVKSIVACSHVYKACTTNNIEQKERDQGGVRGCA